MIDELLIKGYECGDWINHYVPAIRTDPSSVSKRLKFQQGDWVVPIDFANNKFKGSRHPSWVWKAYGQCGQVIGTYSGSAGPHYAVRFPVLKKVFPIHLFFLRKATTEEIHQMELRTRLKKVEDRLPELKGMFD